MSKMSNHIVRQQETKYLEGGMHMPKIDRPMFENFQGSDHMNVSELTELILELVNGKYSIEQLKEDIYGMWDE